MTRERFFDQSREQSLVKTTIVSKYFFAWANVIMPTARRHEQRIAYVDLFAGPGCFKNGTTSTPLLVLERAIADPKMREMLVTIFNDKDEAHCRALKEAITALPGVQRLKHTPQVHNEEVGERMARLFSQMKFVPTLFFVDPWGYTGLSRDLLKSLIKDWGCDCIFFFNYNRINMGLNNPLVEEHMNALFGAEEASRLRRLLSSLGPEQRELTIVEALCTSLGTGQGRYVLPFQFKNAAGTRTKHYLFLVTKHFKGYEIMKEIMAKASSAEEQGVPTFAYSPADAQQPLLFQLSRPLDDLRDQLLVECAGQTLSMDDVYRTHSVGRRYVKRNYKDALMGLEAEGRISADPPSDARRKGTLADHIRVTFPASGG